MRADIEISQPAGGWRQSTWLRALLILGLLYCFFLGLDLMGLSFKLFGKGLATALIAQTANPFVGLFIGILATSLVQSSSTTTSMVVGLVAAGALDIGGAIPIIMGANIGTSVTNTFVSLAHITRPEEFRRAFAGATIHDFFNWMTVLILLPVEIATGILEKISHWAADALVGVGGIKLFDPLKVVVRPVAEGIRDFTGGSALLTLGAGIVFLIFALRYLVVVLRALFAGQAENLLNRTLFRSAPLAILAGAMITVMVQSSSITTSVVVPLVGAGVVTLEMLFPFTIGANIGTTVTAMLAALATGDPAAVTVAFSHLFFNIGGAGLIYPVPAIRAIPLAMARWMGNLAVRSRLAAMAYIGVMFFGLPTLMLFLTRDSAPEKAIPPEPPAIESPAPSIPASPVPAPPVPAPPAAEAGDLSSREATQDA